MDGGACQETDITWGGKSWTQLIDLLANKETESSERLPNLLSHD